MINLKTITDKVLYGKIKCEFKKNHHQILLKIDENQIESYEPSYVKNIEKSVLNEILIEDNEMKLILKNSNKKTTKLLLKDIIKLIYKETEVKIKTQHETLTYLNVKTGKVMGSEKDICFYNKMNLLTHLIN